MRPSIGPFAALVVVSLFVGLALSAPARHLSSQSNQAAQQFDEPKTEIAAKKAPLSVMGIHAGMTDQHVLAIIKARGLPILQIRRSDSLLVEISRKLGLPKRELTYVSAIVTRSDNTLPSLTVDFCENLPDRPGIGVCCQIEYVKKLDKVARLNPTAVAQQFRDALVKRYGEPSHVYEGNGAEWGAEMEPGTGDRLNAGWSSTDYGITLYASSVQERSREGAEFLRDQMLKNLPVPKLDFDF